MRIFKNAWFRRFAKREKISDKTLQQAIIRADNGLIDADLGGHIIKQRIARAGQGKSGTPRVGEAHWFSHDYNFQKRPESIFSPKGTRSEAFTGSPKMHKPISVSKSYVHSRWRQKSY